MEEKVYTVLGGSNPGVFARPRSSPIMPIIIKCCSTAEANAAFGLQPVFKRLNYEKADEDPEAFARALAGSTQIPDLFATQGPFYAVYHGKTERAIYVRNFKPVQDQIHDNMYAKYHRFETIKDALVYMVLKGDRQRMEKLNAPGKKSSMPTPKPKIIYSHLRDFTGIVDTIYGSTSGTLEYTLHDLGKHASYYLESHGNWEIIVGKYNCG
ncbi:hypothetical protein DFH09DRAFT_1117382 [Mycena vulgaris]|nr:hypothetical protein DFH09DRAFT_1117382 [Mycena vulgaris]